MSNRPAWQLALAVSPRPNNIAQRELRPTRLRAPCVDKGGSLLHMPSLAATQLGNMGNKLDVQCCSRHGDCLLSLPRGSNIDLGQLTACLLAANCEVPISELLVHCSTRDVQMSERMDRIKGTLCCEIPALLLDNSIMQRPQDSEAKPMQPVRPCIK